MAKKQSAHRKTSSKATKPKKSHGSSIFKPRIEPKIKIDLKMPARRAGRPPKPKSRVAKPLAPAPIVKTKMVIPKTSSLIITKSAATPPPSKEKPLSQSEINKYRDILMQKRDEVAQLVGRKKETEFQEVEPEIGDEADIATASVEKDLLYEMTDVEQQTLDHIEAALRKIEKGVFGRCEVCGTQIPRQRLDVMPWARNCVFCQSKNELPSVQAATPPAE